MFVRTTKNANVKDPNKVIGSVQTKLETDILKARLKKISRKADPGTRPKNARQKKILKAR